MRKIKRLILVMILLGTLNVHAEGFLTAKEYLEKESLAFFQELNETLISAGVKDQQDIDDLTEGLHGYILGSSDFTYKTNEVVRLISKDIGYFMEDNDLKIKSSKIDTCILLIPSVENYIVSLKLWINSQKTSSQALFELANKHKLESNMIMYGGLIEAFKTKESIEEQKERMKELKKIRKELKKMIDMLGEGFGKL